jgi:hypothetical protein
MNVTLTLHLDAELLRLASEEAEARQTTLPDLMARQVEIMAQNRRDSRAGHTPVTDALRGTMALPAGFDEDTAIADALREKHEARR